MSDTTPVLDSKGNQIVSGSIVVAERHLFWSSFQGKVITPHSDIEDSGHTVAVFFNRDVKSSHFSYSHSVVVDWDERYKEHLDADDLTFLLEGDLLKTCPRAVFFKPEQLVVQEFWSLDTLVKRVFGDRWHTRFNLPKGVSMRSSDYECFIAQCDSRATQIALINVHGSIFPMHVCSNCFSRFNGMCSDDLPEIKVPTAIAQGGPLVIERAVS